MTQIQTLWFDDEWGTDREPAIYPWKRVLDKLQSLGRLRLTCCNSLDEFSRLLQGGPDPEADGQRGRFGLLIIDIMLTEEREDTYASLGFPKERLSRFEAGAQIAALIRSSFFDGKRPPWLERYVDVPILVLSSSPSLRPLVERRVGYSRMKGVELISKSLELSAAGDGVNASPEFGKAILKLLS
jgi:hypothetical protein